MLGLKIGFHLVFPLLCAPLFFASFASVVLLVSFSCDSVSSPLEIANINTLYHAILCQDGSVHTSKPLSWSGVLNRMILVIPPACFSPSVPAFVRKLWGERTRFFSTQLVQHLPVFEVRNGGTLTHTKADFYQANFFFCAGMDDGWLNE